MLTDIIILQNWRGLSVGQTTQVLTQDVDELINQGIAKKVETKQTIKTESKKSAGK